MNRRSFTKLSGTSLLTVLGSPVSAQDSTSTPPFKAKFAPSPNQLFAGKGKKLSYLDQVKLAYDLGFRAWEDNRLNGQENEVIEKISEFMRDKKMEMGVSVITSSARAALNKLTEDETEQVKKELQRGIEVAKITGQTNVTMVPGIRDEAMTREEQIRASVEAMTMCCDIVEEHGLILVQEPLSHPIKGKPVMVESFEDGHLLCQLVNRKSCKLLADFFHEGEIGNGSQLIENAKKVWDQVSYVQYGDSPGRKEPGTGSLDYPAITRFLRAQGYTGIIGMEHRQSKEGQEGLDALLAAYRKIDA